jgi:tetratricopeptide (TPR) repeat protein
MRRRPLAAVLGVLLGLSLACARPYERGERLYRQGDLRGALEVWRGVEPDTRDYERTRARLQLVGEEFDRLLRRYEKRAAFFRSEGRLAEAILYYRLALELDPLRTPLLDTVQELARVLDARVEEEREALERHLAAGRLEQAARHARRLERLDPLDPELQIEIRRLDGAIGTEVLRDLEAGKRAYAAGNRARARSAFESVLALEEGNETALGYLSYIRRFEEVAGEESAPEPGLSLSQEDILAEGHFRAGASAEGSEDPFGAITEYLAALRLQPGHAGARRRLGALRTELSPEVERLHEDGKRYFQDEDLHNALRAWRKVLLIDPKNERARDNAERAERILSRLEEIRTDGS